MNINKLTNNDFFNILVKLKVFTKSCVKFAVYKLDELFKITNFRTRILPVQPIV